MNAATFVLLFAMLAFEIWATLHVGVRLNWHRDDVEAEEFIQALKPTVGPAVGPRGGSGQAKADTTLTVRIRLDDQISAALADIGRRLGRRP